MMTVRGMMRCVDLWILANDATMPMNLADHLPIQIKQTEKQECSTSDSRKPVPNFFV